MRIAVVSAPKHGKEEFIDEFLKTWTNYKRSPEKYLEVIKDNIKLIEKQRDKANRDLITDVVADEMMEYKKGDDIIHSCCPLDTLVSTLWLSQEEHTDIDEAYIKKTMKLAHIALTFLDLIIFLPVLEGYSKEVSDEENQEPSYEEAAYRDEINNLLLAVQESYNKGNTQIFPFETPEGSPALIEIFGNTAERIQMVKLYLDEKGQPYGKNPEDTLISLPNIEEQTDLDRIVRQNLPESQINGIPLVK